MDPEFENPGRICLKGSLLLADPSLREDPFKRSVLLLTEHNHEDGALGYILNRPTGETVSDFISGPEFEALKEVEVYYGGPVGTNQLTFASLRTDGTNGTGVDGTPRSAPSSTWEIQLPTRRAADLLESGHPVRAFVGYAGWESDQLESELMSRSWIPHRFDQAKTIENEDSKNLWASLMKEISPWHRLLAAAPENPELN